MPSWCSGCCLDGTNQTPLRSYSCPHPKPRKDTANERAGSHFMPAWWAPFLHLLLSFLSLAKRQVWALSVCLEINAVVSSKPHGSGNWCIPEKRKW